MKTQPMPPMRARDTAALFGLPLLLFGGLSLADPYLPLGSYVSWAATLLGPLLGLLVGALLALVLYRMLGKSCGMVIGGMIVVIFSVAMLGPSLLRYLNMALDRGPAVPHQLIVTESYERSKGTDTIVLLHWADSRTTFEVDGSYPQGASIEILVHEGNLGLTWIETPRDVIINEMKRERRNR